MDKVIFTHKNQLVDMKLKGTQYSLLEENFKDRGFLLAENKLYKADSKNEKAVGKLIIAFSSYLEACAFITGYDLGFYKDYDENDD